MSMRLRLLSIKTSSEPFLSAIWILLGVIFIGSASMYGVPMMWHTFLAEISAFIMIGLMFIKASDVTAGLATIGSLVWLANQYQQFGYVEPNQSILLMTAIVNLFLLVIALYAYSNMSGTRSFRGIQVFPILIMLVYGFWKVYLDFVTFGTSGIYSFSGGLWATGISLISFATILSIITKPTGIQRNAFRFIAVIGLIIAAYAAMAYGQWLSVIH